MSCDAADRMPLSWHQRTFDNRLDVDLVLTVGTVPVAIAFPIILEQGVT
jgi:hypothetical protein